MIRTLVSVYPDLASVIAMNYACQLSRIIEMGIQPVFVKEPEAGEDAPGVGWVRRTWENSLLTTEREAVDRLIEAERENCSILSRPEILFGKRDDVILSKLLRGAYDLFVEGCVSSFETSELLQRIHSKLYRNLPCPVIIARNLLELRKILIVIDDEVDAAKLLATMIDLFNGARPRFDLLYCRLTGTKRTVAPIEPSRGFFSKIQEMLEHHGWTPESQLALQGPSQSLLRLIEKYSLVVTSLPHRFDRDDALLHLLSDLPSPILLCWQ